MSFHQFWAACAGQYWFGAAVLAAGFLGFILGGDEHRVSELEASISELEDRIRELEEENETLQEGQDESEDLDENWGE